MSKKNGEYFAYNLDLTVIDNSLEFSSYEDSDLMRISCFGCHEGVNGNGLEFTREMLSKHYMTFVDKPIVIVADSNYKPQGHGYDFKKKKFNKNVRRFIGHIVNAYPCIVDSVGKITRIYEYQDQDTIPVGEYRIVCEIVVYKQYERELSETLAILHLEDDLKFSMEGLCDQIEKDGIKHCVGVRFIGLCIVNSPAFKNSYSIEISEMEDDEMDYEKLYNETLLANQELVAEKVRLETEKNTLVAEKSNAETTVLELKESVAELNGKLTDANVLAETLNSYKEKVETAEKLVVGKQRAEKLAKFNCVKTEEELAELTQIQYVDVLEKAVEDYKPEVASKNKYLGLPNGDTGVVSNKDKLKTILAGL